MYGRKSYRWTERPAKRRHCPSHPARTKGPALSPDGRSLAVAINPPGEAQDLLIVDLATGRSVPLAQGPAGEFAPLWAPAGDRVFFVCEVLAYDICSRAPNTSEDESLFLSTHFDTVYVVALDRVSGAPGTPEPLFEGHYTLSSNISYREFDVSSDGERFIMIKQPEDELPRRLVVVTHFFEELKRQVPN